MAEWNSVEVVEAKSLALICTKDQNRFVFLFGTKNKLSSQNPQMKKNNKQNPPPRKQKQNKTKTKNWIPFRSLESTVTQWFLY